jgi:hypothetical protein
VVVKAYPRWDSGNVFGATVEANLVGPTGLVTALEVQGGDEPTEGYRALVPAWAIALEGLYEVRLRVIGLHGTASLSNGEWLPPVAMPVDFVRTASESFVVTPNHCGPSSCLQ